MSFPIRRPTVAPARYQPKTGKLAEIHQRHLQDENPLDATEEVILKRALLEHLLNESEELTDALLAWHRGEPEGTRPPKVPDFDLILKHLDSLSRMATAVQAQKHAERISRAELDRVVGEMAKVVQRAVAADVWDTIVAGWKQIARPEVGR